MKKKCECPKKAEANPLSDMIGYLPEEEAGRVHEPNECGGTYEIKAYKRGNKILNLCSCCHLSGDIEL